MPIGAMNDDADRLAMPFGQQTTFDPNLPNPTESGPVFFPPNTALVIALSILNQLAHQFVKELDARVLQREKHACLDPYFKASMGG